MAEQSSADYRGTLGRYALFGEIAAGGMATVHLARLLGSVGFSRTVAIKRLHPHLAKDPDFVAMFLEEARLAARVRHPNVVATLDVVDEDNELFLVMEYVAGESLSRLVRKTREAGKRVPPRYVAGVVCAALEGLHAAHEATSERGSPLGIVHRDVSPQNIHVGLDGVARVLDFGIAKATNRVQETRTDQIKGKVAYMSPEQLAKGPIDRRADVYSAAVVVWEALTGARLFKADDVPSLVYSIMNDEIRAPSEVAPDLPKELDAVVMKGLDRDPENRWASAREMAVALEKVLAPAPPREIGEWVRETAGEMLAWRIELVHRIESETSTSIPPPMRTDSQGPSPVRDSGVVKTPPPEALGDAEGSADLAEDERETLYRPASDAGEGAADAEYADEDAGRSRAPLMLIAAALLLLGGGLLALRLIQLQQIPDPPAPVASTTVEHEPAIILEVSRSATAPAPPPPPTAPKPRVDAPVAPRPTASAPSDCDNPFTVDAKGVRHPKPHCFKR
ncbi:MAG: serine/threonine protein kinase [Labilithrix sp.]|nr:serine/threonine protein kinase [Labilithrix sp.]MCW5833884.1 serine/threonine protein kinase [Labilithrix sp.]